MPLTIVDRGSHNEVVIGEDTQAGLQGTILFEGDRNLVRIGSATLMQAGQITLGTNCSFDVAAGCRLAALEVVAKANGQVEIGIDSNFTWHTRLYLHEAGKIRIGARCLIASDTLLTVSDMHSIIDRETGRRINPAADVTIGDDVWLAHAVTVLGGSHIGRGSVVGFGSVVTGSLEAYTLSVGRPARTMKSNVTWNAALIP